MNIAHFLTWTLLIVEICIAFPIAYLCILCCSALITIYKRTNEPAQSPNQPQSNFAILVPAHDEEIILGTLLTSLSHLDYPKDLYTVYVIADNCTDTTADLARKFAGTRVYERFDKTKRGKGYALNWILQKIGGLAHDAYVILDADSVVEPTFLRPMDRELQKGAEALQARYTVLNINESPTTVIRWIALTLMNHVRPLGRNGIGGSSTLTGNGMCLSRSLLALHPWQAFGVTEDYQYYLTLVQQGVRVRYVPEAIVSAQMPITFDQMRTQDIRWEASEPQQSQWKIAWQLLREGLRTRSFVRIEALLELLTPPLSAMIATCFLFCITALFLRSPLEIVLSATLLVGLMAYIATALYLLRASRAVYRVLLHTPGFILWKLWVFFVLSKTRKHKQEWVRTARTHS